MQLIKYTLAVHLLLLSNCLFAQTPNYNPSIETSIQGKSNEGYGFSISLSDNGDQLLVGAPYHNNIGKVYLYEYQSGTWVLTEEFYGNINQEYFGFSVKISGDGNTIAIGAPKTDLTVSGNTIVDVGSTNIYKQTGNSWALSDIIYGSPNEIGTSQTQRDISGHYNTAKDYSGYSVSLGYDGNRIVIGEPGFDKVIANGDNQGRARVFDYVNSSHWVLNKSLETNGLATSQTTQSSTLSSISTVRAEDTNANTGAKVSISGDNNTISVSSPNATTSFNGGAIDDLFIMQTSGNASHKDGLISVFKENIANNNWELKAEFLYTKGQTGIGTDLNPDGSIIIFGNPGTKRSYAAKFTHTNAIGSGGEQIYNYDMASNQWTSEHNLQITITGSTAGGRNRRGNNVVISNDGSIMLTKLNTEFIIYEKINNTWEVNRLIKTENITDGRYYFPGTHNIDISGDKNTVAYMFGLNQNPNNALNELIILQTSSSVAQPSITITAESDTKAYDGSALTNAGSSITAGTLAVGHTYMATVSGSQTAVGTSANVASAALIKDASDNDVTANYAITYANGSLAVNQQSLDHYRR